MPTVSIIIPNYNYEKFLDVRINSILNQSYHDYEIIFLDDASTDNSIELVKRHFGKYIHRIETGTANSGNPFVQWNKGVRLAKGEFVWIAEADDSCTPDFLEKMVNIMTSHSSLGLAYCNTIPIDTNGAIIDDGFFNRYVSDLDSTRWLQDFSADGLSEVKDFLARKNTITNVSGVLFRRDAFVRAGYAPENMRMCGDWLTYCRVLHESDVAYVATPMNFHRQHPMKHTQNSVLNLAYFREYLQVQQYVAEAFNQSIQDKRAAFRRFLGEWDRLTVSNYGRIDLPGTGDLARMTAATYLGIGNQFEIAGHLLKNSFRSLAAKWLKN